MVNKKRVGMMMAVTLLIGVLLFCSVFFLVRRANREITQRSFDELATATRQIAKDLADAANADQTILSAMAELIAGHDERDNDAVLRIMKSFSLSETFVSTVALLRPDGTLLLTDGTRYDVSDTFDFETEAARGAYISDRVTSYFAPEKLVVRNVVPVVRDGETVAILYGVVLLQELSRNYQIDLYNGNAFLLLVDGNNGDILLDTWHDSLGNISELRGRKMLKGYTYEEAMEKIPNGIGGDMCTVSRSTGLTLYLHYEPVGINNWSVVLGVSEAEALAGTRGVVETLSMMAIIVTALLLSYLGFMVWYLASARRGVYRMSITDQGTGLMNRVAYEKCLRKSDQRVIAPAACIYIDANGLHEINNHLGHRSGDAMLCFIANAARKFFVSSRIYRIGGDEFVILTPNQPPYSVWVAVDKMRAFLHEKEYEISVGIQSTNDLHRLDDAMNQAEAAMRQDKQAYYARNGQERQLRGLNEKLEQTLTEKRDAEHFLRVLAPKYKSVFVVDLKTDRMRGVIVPDYFQKILDTSGGSFLAVLQQYRDTQVQPACRESLADLLDYNYIRSKVLTGDIVEHTYKKTDDTTFRVKVTPYSKSGTHIDETIWIFSCEDPALTPPPQTK